MLLISLGFGAGKLGVIKREGLSTLAGLMLKVALPCLTISLMEQRGTRISDLLFYHRIILWQIAGYLVLAAVGVLCARLMRLKFPLSNVHAGCMVGNNYAFVVIPLIMALFPSDGGQEYIPICSAVDTISIWTLGLWLFTKGTGNHREPVWKSAARQLTHPIMLSILAMLLLNSCSFSLPSVLSELCDSVGDICYPLGLIYIGANMCYMRRPSITRIRQAGLIVATKLLAVPLLMYAVSARFLPEEERLILMIILGAPTMSTSVMICEEHGLDSEYAATAVFLTTLSILLTIPMLFLLIAYF